MTPHIEKHFTAGDTVRDIVIGMSDGLTVPFALAAGLTGAISQTHLIVTAGFAEIAAGSIAMGLGGYLAARGDAEHYASEKAREEHEIINIPQAEEQEVRNQIHNLLSHGNQLIKGSGEKAHGTLFDAEEVLRNVVNRSDMAGILACRFWMRIHSNWVPALVQQFADLSVDLGDPDNLFAWVNHGRRRSVHPLEIARNPHRTCQPHRHCLNS